MTRPQSGIATDCAHSEKKKKTEFRGVDLSTGEILFYEDIGYQTVNIGEYLGVVSAIKYIIEKNYDCKTVYTDSLTAINWFNNKKAFSKKQYTPLLKAEIFQKALASKISEIEVVHWNNSQWGEIPADFGNKK